MSKLRTSVITAHTFDFSVFERGDWLKGHEDMLRAAKEGDAQAKAAGQIVGRLISAPSCDGYAYYVVREDRGSTVALTHVPYLDGYREAAIEQMGRKVPRRFIDARLAEMDRTAAIYARFAR